MASNFRWIFNFFILTLIQGVYSYDYCWIDHGYHNRRLEYCQYGCCGSSCCADIQGLTGIIVGCVIGGLVLIAIVVTVCVCIQKKKGAAGRVVHPAGYNAGATVVMAQSYPTNQGYGYNQVHQYNPAQGQGTSQPFMYNPGPGAPPPYPSDAGPAYPGGFGTGSAYPATVGEKVPYPPQ